MNICQSMIDKQIQPSLTYGRQIGNSYTASLYVGLAALFDLVQDDLANNRIGFIVMDPVALPNILADRATRLSQCAAYLLSRRFVGVATNITYDEYKHFTNFNMQKMVVNKIYQRTTRAVSFSVHAAT